MPLTKPTFRIAIDDLANEHEVGIMPGDQLRAEVEGNRRGLVEPSKQAMMLTFLWLWAACRREGHVETGEKFETFVDRLVAWERVKVDGGDPDDVATVDPTREAASSTPASHFSHTSPESTGSPASTTTPPSSRPLSAVSSPPTTDPASAERFAGDPLTGHRGGSTL